MLPRILEFVDNRVTVTAEAYGIPEIKAILDKYDMNAEPYLAYCCAHGNIDSPYINEDERDKDDTIRCDLMQVYGEFDADDELLKPAIERLRGFYESAIFLTLKEMEQELHRFRTYLRDNPLTADTMKDRQMFMRDIDKITSSYAKVKKQAQDEIEDKMRGDHELGEY